MIGMFSWQDSAWNAWLPIRERLPHAILIRGAEGSGELEFAQGVAQSLLCEKPRGDRRGCGACPACRWFAQGNHPDFRLLLPDSMLPESQEEGAEPARKEKRSEQIRIEQVRELAGFLAVGNRLLPTVRSRCMKFTLPLPDPGQVARWLKEQGVKQAALAGAGGAPLAALKAAESESERLRFIEGLGDPCFDPIALAETVLRVPPWDLVGWLQRWSYDLLLARIAGRIRYHVNHEGLIADTSRNCEAAEIAAYLRRLVQARALARHPLNAKLFVEDLLLQYQRLIRS